MARLHVYADESGNFDFSRKDSATKYFILTTICLTDHAIAHDLLDLRRELAWEGVDLSQHFHATEEKQRVRDRVFAVLASHDFRVDVTILDKPKTQPHVRSTEERFYKTAWFYHMRHVAPQIAALGDELMVVAASIGTRKRRDAFYGAVKEVVERVSPTSDFRTAFWPTAIDPCLQVADYCSWAVQRKWEHGDERSYALIKNKLRSEYDLFQFGATEYY